ncbi:hypothetical protein DZC78_04070 [Olleya aquimaris]|nr:hypothetical protein DZC78_04070 [Olleya aquimaris]
MNDSFKIGMKVSLNGEFGIVVKSEFDKPDFYGLIRWDNSKESDFEDWRGQFGTFKSLGGQILDKTHLFEFITEDGNLKK